MLCFSRSHIGQSTGKIIYTFTVEFPVISQYLVDCEYIFPMVKSYYKSKTPQHLPRFMRITIFRTSAHCRGTEDAEQEENNA